jgi:hypothetical protein
MGFFLKYNSRRDCESIGQKTMSLLSNYSPRIPSLLGEDGGGGELVPGDLYAAPGRSDPRDFVP